MWQGIEHRNHTKLNFKQFQKEKKKPDWRLKLYMITGAQKQGRLTALIIMLPRRGFTPSSRTFALSPITFFRRNKVRGVQVDFLLMWTQTHVLLDKEDPQVSLAHSFWFWQVGPLSANTPACNNIKEVFEKRLYNLAAFLSSRDYSQFETHAALLNSLSGQPD